MDNCICAGDVACSSAGTVIDSYGSFTNSVDTSEFQFTGVSTGTGTEVVFDLWGQNNPDLRLAHDTNNDAVGYHTDAPLLITLPSTDIAGNTRSSPYDLGASQQQALPGPTLRMEALRIDGPNSITTQNAQIPNFGSVDAALVIANNMTGTGVNNDSWMNIGLWAGSDNCAVSIRTDDGVAGAVQTARARSASHCYIDHNVFGGDFYEYAQISKAITNGVEVNWTRASTSDLIIVLIGGVDNASIERVDLSTSSVNNTVTPGHETNAFFAIGDGASGTDGATTTALISFGVGKYDGSTYEQRHTCWHAQDATTNDNLGQRIFTDKISSQTTASGGVTWDVEVESVTATNFNAKCSTISNGGDSIFFLCLELSDTDEFEIGGGTTPTTIGTKAFTTSGEPNFVGMCQTALPLVNTNYNSTDALGFSLGFTRGGDEHMMGFRSEHNAGTSVNNRFSYTDFMRVLEYNSDTSDIIAGLDSFNSTNFTLDYTAVNATAFQNFWWATVVPSAPPASTWDHAEYYRHILSGDTL